MSGKKNREDEGTSECMSGASVAPPNQRKIVKEKKNQKPKQKTNPKRKNKQNHKTKQKHNKSNILYLNLNEQKYHGPA